MKTPHSNLHMGGPYRGEDRPVRMIIWIAFLMFFPVFSDAQVLEMDFKTLWRMEYENVQPVDVDCDKFDELFVTRKSNDSELKRWGVELIKAERGAYWQYWTEYPIQALGGTDINDDGEQELLAWTREGLSAYLLIFSSKNRNTKKFKVVEGTDLNPPSGWDGGLGFKGIIDVNGDGKNELLISVASYFDLQPRGLLAIDPENGKQLWSYFFGFAPGEVVIADLNQDGNSEIILGSASTYNGSYANGTDDSHTYITALNHKGRLIWQRQIGGHFSSTRVRVVDFELDKKPEIVVMEETDRGDYLGPDQLMILDGSTGNTKKVIRTGEVYRGLILCDLDRDDIPEIITGNTDGVIRAFNASLDVVAQFENENQVIVVDAGDIDGDGHPEILAVSQDGTLFILDQDLKVITRYKTGEGNNQSATLINWGRRKRLLLSIASPDAVMEFAMLEPYRKITVPVLPPLGGLIFFASLIAIMGIVFAAYAVRKTRTINCLLNESQMGILILDCKLRIRSINLKARHVLGIREDYKISQTLEKLELPQEVKVIKETITESLRERVPRVSVVQVSNGDTERRIEVLSTPFERNRRLILLSDVTERDFGHRVATWIPVAQQLAHGIKNPLSHIKLAVQRLEKIIAECKGKKPEGIRYSKIVSEEVTRLLKLTDGFMRFTKLEPPRKEPSRIEDILNGVMNHLKLTIPEEIEIFLESPTDLPEVYIDRVQIRTVLDHLLDNAIAAVEKKGMITIKTAFVEKIKSHGITEPMVEIRVSDTGTGISKEYRSKVFEPYFSLKSGGTGLGLSIARKIVEDHGGTLTLDSVEDLGTTFVITLPTSGVENEK